MVLYVDIRTKGGKEKKRRDPILRSKGPVGGTRHARELEKERRVMVQKLRGIRMLGEGKGGEKDGDAYKISTRTPSGRRKARKEEKIGKTSVAGSRKPEKGKKDHDRDRGTIREAQSSMKDEKQFKHTKK